MLTQEAQEEVRRYAIKLLKSGLTQAQAAEMLEVSRGAVNRWWKRHRDGGMDSLKKRRRGRVEGVARRISSDQEQEVQKIICDKTPDQLKMKFALWSRDAVRQLIRDRYGVDYSLPSMSLMLKRWGFTPQRPLKRAYEQRPAQVKQWLEQEYPKVRERAREQNAEIWWGDETAVKPECHFRRSFSPKGKTPVVRQPAKRFHSALISAINNQGKMQWMPLAEPLNADLFIKFLRQLIKWRKRKIFLIVDNLRVHHSGPVKDWLEQNRDRIELVYLPAYSPELNPDEYLNNHLKQTVTREGIPDTKDELDDHVWLNMTMLKHQPDLISAFFRHPSVTYAVA